MGIICKPPSGIGLTDLPKTGGSCPLGHAPLAIYGSEWRTGETNWLRATCQKKKWYFDIKIVLTYTANVCRDLRGVYREIGVRGFQIYGDCM